MTAINRLRSVVLPTFKRPTVTGAAVPALVLFALISVVAAKDPTFISTRSLGGLLVDAAPLVVLATGSALVILLGGIDLSGAALASLSSVLLAEWLADYGWIGLAGVLVVGASAGAVQGTIQGVTQTPSFIVTLGGLGVFSGIALKVSGERTQSLGDGASIIEWIGDASIWFIPASFLVALGVSCFIAFGLHGLARGRDVYLVGLSEAAAAMSGARPTRVRIAVFATAGFCAAVAGTIMTARTTFGSPTLANGLLLPTIAAVVVGGTAISGGVGGITRTILGALIVVTIRAGSVVWGVEPVYQDVVFGALVIVAVALTTDRSKLNVIK